MATQPVPVKTDNGPTGDIWQKAKAERNWLVWKLVPITDANGNVKLAKRPLDPFSFAVVDRADAARLTYDEARTLVDAKQASGVGYAPRAGSAMVGDDLDDCFDASTGAPDAHASAILAMGETYCEKSPSGRGLRVLRARDPNAVPFSIERRGVGVFEVVEAGRGKFFTVRAETEFPMREITPAPTVKDYILKLYASRTGRPAQPAGPSGVGEKLPLDVVANILAQLDPETDYNRWIAVGLAVKWCAGDVDGLPLWDAWSARAPNYGGPQETADKWAGLDPTGSIGGGYLVMQLEDEGKALPEHLQKLRAQDQARSDFGGTHNPNSPQIQGVIGTSPISPIPEVNPFTGQLIPPGAPSVPGAPQPSPGVVQFPQGTVQAAQTLAKNNLAQHVRSYLKPVGAGVFQTPQPSPPMIVTGLLPASVGTLVGPGGVSKTSLLIHLSIQLILGRDWWGFPVEKPGPVLIFTKEDEMGIFRKRVHDIGTAMGLTPQEQAHVGDALVIVDKSRDLSSPLVAADRQGNMHVGDLYDEVDLACSILKPSLVAFDPMNLFGPGEQHVNTGEAALMGAGRNIAVAHGCGLIFVHHTGQGAAREKVTDMYAGRGGSAAGDNARMVSVIHRVDAWDGAEMPGIDERAVDEDRVSALTIAKLSYAKRPQERLFVVHDPANHWTLHLIKGVNMRGRAQKQAQANAQADKDCITVREFILDAHAKGQALSPHGVARGADILDRNGKKLSRTRIDKAVATLLDRGEIIEDAPVVGAKGGRPTSRLLPGTAPSVPVETKTPDDVPF